MRKPRSAASGASSGACLWEHITEADGAAFARKVDHVLRRIARDLQNPATWGQTGDTEPSGGVGEERHRLAFGIGRFNRGARKKRQRLAVGLQQLADCGDVVIGTNWLPTSPVVVTADRNRLLQVLANLLSNAAKFSPSEEQVIVRLGHDAGKARISVIDHGMGIAEEFRDRLFERFSQHDASSTRVQPGTGLGLAITKSIVEQLGGSVLFEPTRPKGATFHVELPLTAADDA